MGRHPLLSSEIVLISSVNKHTLPLRWIKLISPLVEISDVVAERDANMASWVDAIWVVELILLTKAYLVA